MNEIEVKSPWESVTIRAIVKGAITTAVAMILRVTGSTYDMGWISDLVNYLGDLALYGLNFYWYWEAYKGRINATYKIEVKK